MTRAWALLHLFFAFSFVGTLVVSDWNSRAARATEDWGRRALLFDIIGRASRVAGLGSLLLLGVFGNLLSVRLDYRMATDVWVRWTNGVWLAALLVLVVVCLPSLRRLEALCRAGSNGGSTADYPAVLGRWRAGNALLSALYLALLALMVFRWRG